MPSLFIQQSEIPDLYRTPIKVALKLVDHGYSAYLVGGCVRDLLLEIETKDFDIATNCPVSEVKKLIPKAKQKKPLYYGVFELKIDTGFIEIAHFREDYAHEGRHSKVRLVDTLERDLKRRDFTVNALAFHPGTLEVVDLWGGLEDLDNKTLDTVGDPQKRFKEDALRMLRGARFAAKLGFSLERRVVKAIKANSHLVEKLSPDWLRKEYIGILECNNSEHGIRLLRDTGLDKYLLPGVMKIPEVFEATLDILNDADKANFDYQKKLTILLRKETPDRVEAILTKLKFPKSDIKRVMWFVTHLEGLKEWEALDPLEFVALVDNDDFEYLLSIVEIVYAGDEWRNIEARLKIIVENREKGYILNGEDIKNMLDIKPGKLIKEILINVRYKQLLGEIKTKNEARRYIKKGYGKT